MTEVMEEITNLFARNNIPVFGSIEGRCLEKELSGCRPSDMLSSAQSILCFGLPVPKGIFQCRERSEWMYWRAANVYYRNIDAVLVRACSIVEEKGKIAVPVFG